MGVYKKKENKTENLGVWFLFELKWNIWRTEWIREGVMSCKWDK